MTCFASPLCEDGCSFEAVCCHFIAVLMSWLLIRVYLSPGWVCAGTLEICYFCVFVFIFFLQCACLTSFHSLTLNPWSNKVLMKGTKRFGLGPLAFWNWFWIPSQLQSNQYAMKIGLFSKIIQAGQSQCNDHLFFIASFSEFFHWAGDIMVGLLASVNSE